MNIDKKIMPKGHHYELTACGAACAATGIELAETVVGYILWVAWCTSTFCGGMD